MLRTNFFKTALATMLVVCAMGFYSCSSDDGEPETPPTDESSIVGKWDVQSNTRAAGDAKYGSFEFTADKRYIITQPTTVDGEKILLVVSGEYKAESAYGNEFTLDLKDLGVIKISITENHASITIGGVSYVAVKAPEVDLADNTKKLCGTWEIRTQYTDLGDTEPVYEGTWTFTSAGTYMTMFINDPGTDNYDIGNGIWSWKSDKTITISGTDYEERDGKIYNIQHWTEELSFKELTDTSFYVDHDYIDEDTGKPENEKIFGTKK